MEEKTITIRVPDDLHTRIKVHIAKEKKSLKDYIVYLIEKDLAEKEYSEKKK